MQSTLIQELILSQKVGSKYIDDQNLISKLSLLELLQKYEKYLCLDSSYNTSYYKRIETSLRFIPQRYQLAALTLFANVFYIGESVLSDALSYLFTEVVAYYGNDPDKVIPKMHVFEVDPSGLIESFFRVNKIEGRLDTNVFSRCKSPGDFVTALNTYSKCDNMQQNIGLQNAIKPILEKDCWILLTDFSFSGTSVSSDINRLVELRKICFSGAKKPDIILCVQIISSEALKIAQTLLKGNDKVFYAQCYDDSYKILPRKFWPPSADHPFGSCTLFEKDKHIYTQIVQLCGWFAKTYIDRDPAHQNTLKTTPRKTLAFGYKDCGLTVIPQRNAPSNSLPILWYRPSKEFLEAGNKDYMPPFPRTISRVSQSPSGDKENLEELKKHNTKVRRLLKKLIPQQ